MPIDPRMVKWEDVQTDSPAIDPRMVKWEDEKPKQSKRRQADAALSAAVAPATNYSPTNLNAGLVRGAGSIGATLIRPFESAADNAQRRTQMDAGLQTLGADPTSMPYQTGKLGAEIAGTAGVGGLLGKAAAFLKAPQAVVTGLQTSGLNVAGKTGLSGLVTRGATGAAVGGVSTGLINPEAAGEGALAGAALPVLALGAGRAGEYVGKKAKEASARAVSEFNRNAPRNETLKQALDAGYVVPPNMVNPSFKNQVIESISGKQATQQVFSGKNEEVTGSLVRKSLGIADDAPLSKTTLEGLRKTAGKAYEEVSSLSPQAAADLEALKQARNDATGWFNAYNRSASPADLAKAKEARALSNALEDALEQHAKAANRPELIPALRDARKQIAKTYTVGRALNDASGTIDARVLGRMHEKGLPLSDGLDVAGKFASAFPTVAKSSQQVGSQAAHNMKAIAASVLGGGGALASGPVGLTAAAIPFVTPPIARSAMLRSGAQKALVKQAPKVSDSALAKILMDQEIQRLLLRSAPAVVANQGP